MDGWRRVHWVLFAVVAASFFLDGVLFVMVPATIYLLPDLAQNATLIFAVNTIAFMLGALALGRLGDVVGRRLSLIVSLVIYTVGALWFALAYCAGVLDLVAAVFTTSLIYFGVGGKAGLPTPHWRSSRRRAAEAPPSCSPQTSGTSASP